MVLAVFWAAAPIQTFAQDLFPKNGEFSEAPVLMLGKATVSEEVRNRVPINETIAISANLKNMYCFTDFLSVSDRTIIYHNWYRNDQRYASVKLSVRPPRWATYSSVALAQNLKGPWRIEITDSGGNILRILRFSVID
jgi:hypothetical protein